MPETLPYSYPANIPSGTDIVTINGISYILDDFTPNADSQELARKDNKGAPNGFKLLKSARTATATAQLESTATPIPQRGMEFTYKGTVWVIKTHSDPEKSDALTVVNLTLRERI